MSISELISVVGCGIVDLFLEAEYGSGLRVENRWDLKTNKMRAQPEGGEHLLGCGRDICPLLHLSVNAEKWRMNVGPGGKRIRDQD